MFTFADAIVGVVLLVSAGMAFLRGFVHEVLAIAAWAGAAAATLYGYDTVEPWAAQQISATWAAQAATGVGLFLSSLLVLSLVTKAVSNQVRKSALNSVDSSLGFVFGLLRGALLLSVGYYIAAHWIFEPSDMPGWLDHAKTKPWLVRGAEQIEHWRPHSLDGAAAMEPGPVPVTGDLVEDSKRGSEQMGAAPAVDAMVTPKLIQKTDTAKDTPAKAKGYDKEERSEMDRLFKTNK